MGVAGSPIEKLEEGHHLMRFMQASRKEAIDALRRCLLEGQEDQHDTLVIADDNMYYRCGL